MPHKSSRQQQEYKQCNDDRAGKIPATLVWGLKDCLYSSVVTWPAPAKTGPGGSPSRGHFRVTSLGALSLHNYAIVQPTLDVLQGLEVWYKQGTNADIEMQVQYLACITTIYAQRGHWVLDHLG